MLINRNELDSLSTVTNSASNVFIILQGNKNNQTKREQTLHFQVQ